MIAQMITPITMTMMSSSFIIHNIFLNWGDELTSVGSSLFMLGFNSFCVYRIKLSEVKLYFVEHAKNVFKV